MSEYIDYYKGKLEQALVYQDFVVDKLRKYDAGIIILACSSRKYQQDFGESFSGVEIKHDMRMKDTGNVYIETAEKANPNNVCFVPSGIYRKDKCWLYLIGDYERAFLFGKKQLQKLYENDSLCKLHGICKRTTETSQGFTYPVDKIMKSPYLLYYYDFGKENMQ